MKKSFRFQPGDKVAPNHVSPQAEIYRAKTLTVERHEAKDNSDPGYVYLVGVIERYRPALLKPIPARSRSRPDPTGSA